ncbi:MAG TPA: hypothetical protein VLZ54_12910 [Arenibacter sp.]|nr:hypothetical protein [Arenibacter sp.]
MENQNCRVGSVNPITQGTNAIQVLEYQYQRFMEKASSIKHTNSNLAEFFELKAAKIRKILENL